MGARKIEVSVECCDPHAGDMQLTVEDPDNPDAGNRYQDMFLHPAVCAALHELLGYYVASGQSTMTTVRLNAPEAADA